MARNRLLSALAALLLGSQLAAAPPAAALQNGLARIPPMGWNSWNKYGCAVTEANVEAQADAIVATGLSALGYSYVTVDDCWMAAARDAAGALQADRRASRPG